MQEENTVEQAIVVFVPHTYTVDEQVVMWLHAKFNLSGSRRTQEQYEDHMRRFRGLLHKSGLDLDSPDEATVAAIAQGYAALSEDGRTVAGATYNQRVAALSSFYQYAIKHRWLSSNPMQLVERRIAYYNNAALPLSTQLVKDALKSIDRSTTLGKRDYALLVLLFNTGRRVSEVCDLRCGDIEIGGESVTITWRRCKGGKMMRDQVENAVARALIEYLTSIYDGELHPESPVWISFSRNASRGATLGTQAIAGVCMKYLNISQVHATRHSFAILMEEAGARLSDIGERLGHSNLATTSRYMQRLHSAENAYAGKIAVTLGIGE